MITPEEMRKMAERLNACSFTSTGEINIEAAAMLRSIAAEMEAKIEMDKAFNESAYLGTGVTFVSSDGTISHVPFDEYRKASEDKDA